MLASREAHRRSDMLTRRRVTYASVVELYSAVRRLKPLRFPRASGSGLARALGSKPTRLRGRDCFGGLLPREEDAGMTAVRKYRPFADGLVNWVNSDPLRPFDIGLVNGREALESGFRLKAQRANRRSRRWPVCRCPSISPLTTLLCSTGRG